MRRRTFLQTSVSGLAGGLLATAASPQRPNIVYILADDLGWGDLSVNNPASELRMPNAARLAREGMRFTDMHSPSSVCTPTRYGILTGRYCWRTSLKKGVLNGRSPALIEPGRTTVASLLAAQGYRTAGIGKWHLGLGNAAQTDYAQPLTPGPREAGFQYYYGIPASLDMEPYLFFENDRPVAAATEQTPGANEPRGYFWRAGGIAPGFTMEGCLPRLTEKAVEFVKAQKREQPFFLYLPLTGPHTPWAPVAEFKGKSRAGLYGDFVEQVDHALGQVLRALDETGQTANTLVIFTSDNGAHWTPEDRAKFSHRANAAWKGQKADVWEAGHRIPFVVRWPGQVRAGSVSQATGCLTDLLATVADITGARLPAAAGEDSISLLPALRGRKPLREAVVHHSMDGVFAIRQGDWKLALGRGSGGFSEPKRIEQGPGEPPGELYDLRRDPEEKNNVYAQHPEKVKALTALLERYQRDGRSRP